MATVIYRWLSPSQLPKENVIPPLKTQFSSLTPTYWNLQQDVLAILNPKITICKDSKTQMILTLVIKQFFLICKKVKDPQSYSRYTLSEYSKNIVCKYEPKKKIGAFFIYLHF